MNDFVLHKHVDPIAPDSALSVTIYRWKYNRNGCYHWKPCRLDERQDCAGSPETAVLDSGEKYMWHRSSWSSVVVFSRKFSFVCIEQALPNKQNKPKKNVFEKLRRKENCFFSFHFFHKSVFPLPDSPRLGTLAGQVDKPIIKYRIKFELKEGKRNIIIELLFLLPWFGGCRNAGDLQLEE